MSGYSSSASCPGLHPLGRGWDIGKGAEGPGQVCARPQLLEVNELFWCNKKGVPSGVSSHKVAGKGLASSER